MFSTVITFNITSVLLCTQFSSQSGRHLPRGAARQSRTQQAPGHAHASALTHSVASEQTCTAWRTCCSVAARASKCCALSSASRASRLSLSRSTCSQTTGSDQASMRKQGSSTDALGRERVRECRDFDLECLRLRRSSFRLPCPQHRRTHTSCSPSIQCGGMRTQCLAERL